MTSARDRVRGGRLLSGPRPWLPALVCAAGLLALATAGDGRSSDADPPKKSADSTAGFDRSPETRTKLVKRFGGNAESEAAVARGLIWLAKQQKPDGSWEFDGSSKKETVAATGMALLPFLAAGQTHKEGKYSENVKKGLAYLLKELQPNGQFRGTGMYAQAIGTIALCEAYGMTGDAALKPRAQAAVNFIVRAQHEKGGWRYQPGQPGDTSATGWQVQALHAARLANLQVPEATLKKASQFLDSVSKDAGATYGYLPDSPQPTPTLTAVGLLCRQMTAGWTPKTPALGRGVEFIKKASPRETRWDTYYYYYATQTLHLYGGPSWHEDWNPKMRDLLVKMQEKRQGPDYGSWKKDNGQIGSCCGRLGTTALAVLTLEVYYRHLPFDQRRTDGAKEAKKP